MKIQFVLAARDENGNCTNGINRVNLSSNSTFSSHGIGYNSTDNGLSPSYLQTNYGWDEQEYYNIYVSPEVNILGTNAEQNCIFSDITTLAPRGFASFPCTTTGGSKGCYMLSSSFAPNSRDRVFTHEIGHSLGLLHTFQGQSGSNCPPDNNCATQGDYCCDIAAHKEYNGNNPAWTILDCDATLFSNSNSCSSLSNNTWKYNFMNYGGINCRDRFSNDQKTRARNAVELYYDDLLQSNGCLSLTPPSNVNIDFSASKTSLEVTESTRFSFTSCGVPISGLNNDSHNSSFLWTISDQSNSNLPMKSRKMNPTFTFYNAGTYNVKLDITVNGTTYTKNKTAYISVSNQASISSTASQSGLNAGAPVLAQGTPTFDFAPEFGKVWLRIDKIEKLDNDCNASGSYLGTSDGDLEYINKVCAVRYSTNSTMYWQNTSDYGPYDESSETFEIYPNYIFFHEDLDNEVYYPYKIAEASWEDDDGIQGTWATCSSFFRRPYPM